MCKIRQGSGEAYRQHAPPEFEAHLRETVERLADPLREAWAAYCAENELGTPAIHVSSGYRCPALNKAWAVCPLPRTVTAMPSTSSP